MRFVKHTLYVSCRKGKFDVWGTKEDAEEFLVDENYRGNWVMCGEGLGEMTKLFSKIDITKITIEAEEESKVL